MFIGAVPAPLVSIVHEHTRRWKVEDIHVLCSGNFTLERALHPAFRLHSNDVSIYTTALGLWLAGRDMPLTVREDQRDEFGWLEDEGYLQSPVAKAATIMLGTRAFAGIGRANAFYARQRQAFRGQWPRLHAQTVEKLNGTELRLVSYTACDAAEFIHTVPLDGAVCSFPPFYKGGYETLYAPLEQVLAWQEPEYEVMDRDGLHQLLAAMRERKHWLYGTDHRVAGHEKWLRGIVQVSNRNVPIFVYGSGGRTRWTGPSQNVESVHAPRLRPGQPIGDELALAKLTAGRFNALRAFYLDPRIAPAGAMLPLAVLADGVIIGVIGLNRPNYGLAGAYLLSDFAVGPTDYPRLSKLVLMAALSREAQMLMERTLSRRVRTITTTAFSDRPASMKYRGLFRMVKRTETPGAARMYQLQYEAQAGQWTLAEALKTWRAKWGERVGE